MSISKASGQWKGTLKDGKGTMKPLHGPEVPFSLTTRFEGEPGSNPEELIGAALSGCFSMALAAAFSKARVDPISIETQADVKLEKVGAGFRITAIELHTVAKARGMEDAQFQSLAEETKRTCPVSQALAPVAITLDAKLEAV